MYVYCIYICHVWRTISWDIQYMPCMENNHQNDRNKRHSSPFINFVKGVFFVVRVTLVPVSYLSAPSAVDSYRQCTYIVYIYVTYGGQSAGIYNICHVWRTITRDIQYMSCMGDNHLGFHFLCFIFYLFIQLVNIHVPGFSSFRF
jgi:hypothetical protein